MNDLLRLASHLEDWQQRDLSRLAELYVLPDPRSIDEMIASDSYDEIVVERAEYDGERTVISWDGGTTTAVEGPEIKVGDRVQFYGGAGLGDTHHGWALNGKVIEWKTPWERYAGRIALLAELDRKKRERVEQERSQVMQWAEQLHGPYRQRIDRFMVNDATFVLEGGTYETYPVLMAQRIEEWVREHHPDAEPDSWEAAVAFVKELECLPYEEQRPVLHGGQEDRYGVSGHQVDSAFGLAAAVLCGKDI